MMRFFPRAVIHPMFGHLFGLATLAAVTGCDGCDRREGPVRSEGAEPEQTVSPSRIARALGKDASELTPPVDPPPATGDLKGDLQHFTTVDACVAERAALDPVVGDALLAIGYDTFLRDACRVLDATKAKDARRCAAIGASSLRLRCEANVAMAAANAEACPLDIAGDATRGHDPTCIAVASRDVRLCAGESAPKRHACEALVTGDEKRCGETDRHTCARDAARWKGVLLGGGAAGSPSPLPSLPPLPAPKGTLSIRGADGTSDPMRTDSDLALEVGRGVVLTRQLGAIRLRVGSLQELGAIPHTANPVAGARIGFELMVAGEAPADAKIERLELAIPGAITIVVPAMRSTLKARVTKLDKSRGGQVHLIIEGQTGSAPRTYAVRAEISTFVRDLVGFSGSK